MVNYMQIACQNIPVKPLEGILDIIYIDLIGVYVNGKTSGIHNNKGGGKLCYMSMLEQPSVCDTQSGSTEFPEQNKSWCDCDIPKCQCNGSHYIGNNKSIGRKYPNMEALRQGNASRKASRI